MSRDVRFYRREKAAIPSSFFLMEYNKVVFKQTHLVDEEQNEMVSFEEVI